MMLCLISIHGGAHHFSSLDTHRCEFRLELHSCAALAETCLMQIKCSDMRANLAPKLSLSLTDLRECFKLLITGQSRC